MASSPPTGRWSIDRVWRWGLFVAYRLLRVWWFVRRPEVHGAWVAVWSGSELLLIRNSYRGGETVPCGAIARGESPREAATRELAEEVGIAVSPDRLSDCGKVVMPFEFKLDHAHFFELHLDARPALTIDRREVVWAGFCAPEALASRPLVPPLRAYLARRS